MTAVGVLVPVGTMLTLAVRYGRTVQSVEELRADVVEIKRAIPLCQKERRDREAELHGRITELATTQAAHQEKTEAVDYRVSRLEKRANGHAA